MTTDPHDEAWWIEPRDPLVFGNGAQAPALVPRHPWQLPPHSTFAGFVRSRFVHGKDRLSDAEARDLLEIRVAGPWLARRRGAEFEVWLPAPADVALVGETVTSNGGKSKVWHCLRSGFVQLRREEEGVLWPPDLDLDPVVIQARARSPAGGPEVKTRRPEFPFFPFEDVVSWSLGELKKPPPEAEPERRDPPPVAHEGRVHVAIDRTTRTALPEALFSSGGLRFQDGFGLLASIAKGQDRAAVEGLGVLGAEARTVRCTPVPGPAFPPFSRYRARFDQWLEERKERPCGLRLQLVTPGCFGGWRPPLRKELQDKLRAVCLPRYVPISGWNLKAAGPRPVRRLVPAGTVYTLGPFADGEEILRLCEEFWGQLLEDLTFDPKQGEESFLAPPTHDGYGQVVSTPCSLDDEETP